MDFYIILVVLFLIYVLSDLFFIYKKETGLLFTGCYGWVPYAYICYLLFVVIISVTMETKAIFLVVLIEVYNLVKEHFLQDWLKSIVRNINTRDN